VPKKNKKPEGIPVLRKTPTQERSRERVERICAAAAELFEAQGYDAVSTNAIAAKAQVPIGSLYQFFPDKKAILIALAERCADGSLQRFATLATAGVFLKPLGEMLEQGVATFAQFHEELPAFRTVMGAWQQLPELTEGYAALHLDFEQRTAEIVALRAPHLQPALRATMATLVVHTMDAILNLGVTRPVAERKRLVKELRTLLFRYLEPYERS
jgi:AcrR family transcriptional regulator